MAGESFHALVVDDNAMVRQQLCRALQRIPGMRASEASNGADGWRMLSTDTFQLLLTDINMPVMDGLKLVSMVRNGGPHQAIPIVVITTESAEADRERAISLGATAYLNKPIQAPAVVAAVKELLHIE
jgi:two-component system chemotaxis response regulator CheY